MKMIHILKVKYENGISANGTLKLSMLACT